MAKPKRQPPRFTPKEISHIVQTFMQMPGMTVARGGGVNPGYTYIPGNAFWNQQDKKLHLNREWYNDIAHLRAGDKKGALAIGILLHELGHINQPAGRPNATGGMDVDAQYRLDMENQADAFARSNIASIMHYFFPNERVAAQETKMVRNQFNRWRKAHAYKLEDF